MKKKIILSLIVSLFFGTSFVKADTTEVNTTLTHYYQFFDYYITTLQTENNPIDQLFSYYNSNLSDDYPYYVLYMTNYGYLIILVIFSKLMIPLLIPYNLLGFLLVLLLITLL